MVLGLLKTKKKSNLNTMHEGQSLTAWELIVIAIVGTHGFSIRYTLLIAV